MTLRVPIYNVKRVSRRPVQRFVHNEGMMLPALIALSATLAAPVPLGTHETFGGTVNDTRTGATIRMACFGPDRPGRLGHPMAGQSVGAYRLLSPIGQGGMGTVWLAERQPSAAINDPPKPTIVQSMPAISVVDLRAELRAGNRSMFSAEYVLGAARGG